MLHFFDVPLTYEILPVRVLVLEKSDNGYPGDTLSGFMTASIFLRGGARASARPQLAGCPSP